MNIVTITADVPQRIRALIAENQLERGDRLPPERELAATLGVSRPALREGLRRMVDLGTLEPRQGSGTYVSGVDPAELLEVRDRLEPHAARLAARNRTAIDESAFTRILEDLQEGVPGAYTELRQAIAGASGNTVLAAIIGVLIELDPSDVKASNRVIKDMTRVVEQIHARDGAGARQAMRRHLARLAK